MTDTFQKAAELALCTRAQDIPETTLRAAPLMLLDTLSITMDSVR